MCFSFRKYILKINVGFSGNPFWCRLWHVDGTLAEILVLLAYKQTQFSQSREETLTEISSVKVIRNIVPSCARAHTHVALCFFCKQKATENLSSRRPTPKLYVFNLVRLPFLMLLWVTAHTVGIRIGQRLPVKTLVQINRTNPSCRCSCSSFVTFRSSGEHGEGLISISVCRRSS